MLYAGALDFEGLSFYVRNPATPGHTERVCIVLVDSPAQVQLAATSATTWERQVLQVIQPPAMESSPDCILLPPRKIGEVKASDVRKQTQAILTRSYLES